MRCRSGMSIDNTQEPLVEGQGLTGKVKLITKLCQDPCLSAAQFRVTVALLLHFHNTRNGKCFPSYSQLAAASCTSKTTAKRTTKKLKAIDVVDVPANQGGRSRRNSYDFKTVSPADPSSRRKGVRGGPFKKLKSVVTGPETSSPADPHIPNEESKENGRVLSSASNGRSHATELSTHQKLSPEEIKRRDQRVSDLKAQLSKTAEHMSGKRRSPG